jgi:hypothetical protein
MRLILIFLFFLAFYSNAKAEEIVKTDALTKNDFKVSRKYGYKSKDLKGVHERVKKLTNSQSIIKEFMNSIENDPFDAAQLSDQAMDQIIITASIYLKAENHDALAEEIGFDYQVHYRGYFTRMFLGEKEIGDHPPVSGWLESVHAKTHNAIGDFLCQYSHIHDIYILNHANVVFKPAMAKDLKDYKDHFAGHLIWDWWWEHHGFAGVVSYWLVNSACTGVTAGMGLVTFACGPISGFAENQVDRRIAPVVAERIWNRN